MRQASAILRGHLVLFLMLLITAAAVAPWPGIAAAEQRFDEQLIFEKGRVPKIVVTTHDVVLAFGLAGSELRRSEDGGNTWSDIIAVTKGKRGNVVVDENTGDVLDVLTNDGELARSSDDGKTWKRETITMLPNLLGHGLPEHMPADGGASESGITLKYGEHKGRLILPVRISPPDGSNSQENWPCHYNAAVYSDDGGKTWQVSGPVQSGTGEGTLTEFSDGSLYYNSRSHMSIDNYRRIAMSYTGGKMWVDWRVDLTLQEPGEPFYFEYGSKPSYGCNAGLLRLPLEMTDGHDVLLFSTPDNPGGKRIRMTVWASFDRGQTWPVKRLVYPETTGYSSLAVDSKGTIYLLYEHGTRGDSVRNIHLARFNMEWLLDGRDWKQLIKNP